MEQKEEEKEKEKEKEKKGPKFIASCLRGFFQLTSLQQFWLNCSPFFLSFCFISLYALHIDTEATSLLLEARLEFVH